MNLQIEIWACLLENNLAYTFVIVYFSLQIIDQRKENRVESSSQVGLLFSQKLF